MQLYITENYDLRLKGDKVTYYGRKLVDDRRLIGLECCVTF